MQGKHNEDNRQLKFSKANVRSHLCLYAQRVARMWYLVMMER